MNGRLFGKKKMMSFKSGLGLLWRLAYVWDEMKEFADLVAEWPVVADVNESSERNTEEHEEQVGDC